MQSTYHGLLGSFLDNQHNDAMTQRTSPNNFKRWKEQQADMLEWTVGSFPYHCSRKVLLPLVLPPVLHILSPLTHANSRPS